MAKKSARKEITKINLKQAALEGLSYERACETAKRAGKPSYRFTVGDKVQVGHLLNCVVDEALEGGYMYLIRSGANSDNYSCLAWTNVRPLDDDKDTHFAKREVFDTFEEAEASIRAKIEADNIKLPKSDPNDENDELWKLSDALYARDVANGVVKTRLDAIRSLDKLRLAVFLNDIHSNVKDFPSDNLSWCDRLNKPDDGHLLDVKTAR